MPDKLGLSAEGRRILSALETARDPGDLAALGLDGDLARRLLAAGLLQPQAETAQGAHFTAVFSGWKSQKGMLIDEVRTLAFQRAIEALVAPGNRVIDVGTGSGILAMMAARAGAGVVHALELTDMAAWAARLAARNGLDAVQVTQGDAAAFDAGGPVDLVMGEFAGMWLLEEWRHYAAFVRTRDRWLKPGGQVLPHAARLYLSAVDSHKLHRERGWGFFDAPVYGFDLSEVLTSGAHQPQRYILSADHSSQVCTRQIAAFDYRTGTERDVLFTTEVAFPYAAAGRFHGFIGHFELDLAPGVTLSTGTGARETHWHQSYFPLPALTVPAGGAVVARLRTYLDGDAQTLTLGITVALEGEALDGRPEHVFPLD